MPFAQIKRTPPCPHQSADDDVIFALIQGPFGGNYCLLDEMNHQFIKKDNLCYFASIL